MLRVVFLSLLALLVSAIALAVWAPLSAFVDRDRLKRLGLTYVAAQGSIWDGHLTGLRAGGEDLGTASIAVSPNAVLRLRLAANVALTGGPLTGSGRVERPFSGTTLEAYAVTLRTDLSSLRAIAEPIRVRGGTGEISLDRLVYDPRQGCLAASGRVSTDVLDRRDPRIDWRGPALSGDIRCDGADLVATLRGNAGDETVHGTGRLTAGGRFILEGALTTEREDVAQIARLMGFRSEDGVLEYSRDVALFRRQ